MQYQTREKMEYFRLTLGQVIINKTMTEIPRIAIFKPEPKEEEKLLKLFEKHEYSIRMVPDAAEAEALVREEDAPFDVLLIPLRLFDRSSGISVCLQAKSMETLASTPVLGVSMSTEKPVIQAFYEVGADIVLISPTDADLFRFQILAMTRQRRAYDEQIRVKQESSGFSRSIISAFNIVREGLLIFNSNFEYSFGNASSRMLLGLDQHTSAEQILAVEKLFRQLLVQHHKNTRTRKPGPGQDHPISQFETSLTRVDRRAFRANVRISSLYATDNHLMGYTVSVTDLSELDQLSNSLLQSQRTRSLCLLAASASTKLISSSFDNITLSPLNKLTPLLEQNEKKALISPILTTLMEYLDLVISTDTRVKVKSKEETMVALRPTDLFQLFGHIILDAVQFAGKAGEVMIDVSGSIPGEGVTALITGQSRKVTPFIPNDYLANLIQGDITAGSTSEESAKMNIGLAAAQEIAAQYRTTVEYQTTSEGKRKVRVKLPPCYK